MALPTPIRACALVSILSLAGCRRPDASARTASVHALRSTPGGVDIPTYGVDNARTSWNRRETVLTPDNVRPETFGRIATADNVYNVLGSPLFASALPVRDGRTGMDVRADVLLVATMQNEVFALDADDLGTLWRFDFGGLRPAWADDLVACQSHYQMGVLSTPVLSPDRSMLYVVGRVATSDSTRDTWLQGFALRTRDGSVAARFRVGETVGADGVTRTPITLDAMDRGRAVRLTFTSHQYTQRSALLLVGNNLYVSTGGICDTPGFRGWLLAYDVTRLSERTGPVAVYAPTPGGGGGMWAAGGAASDGRSIFVAIGNGRADLRVDTAPATRSISDALVRLESNLSLDARACFNVASPTAPCGPADAANLRNVFMPRHAELLARETLEDLMPMDGDIGSPDEDFGSSGPLLVPAATLAENRGVDDGRNLAALGGKDGFFYLVDRDRMGGVGPSRLHGEADLAGLVGAELDSRELFLHSTSGGIRANAAYFEGHTGRYLYAIGADEVGGRADSPRGVAALRLVRTSDPTPAQCAAQFRRLAYRNTQSPCATIWGAAPHPGFELAWSGAGAGALPGGSPFVSSNGNAQGIVWVTHPVLDDDHGLLEAYAAEGPPGALHVIAPIYRSDRTPDDDLPHATVFAGPVVANGRVYVTGDNVVAYGLLDRRELPPVTEAPPPDCPAGVTWESHGQPFMRRYCTLCHAEYQDLGFIQRRNRRVATSIMPAEGEPSMPLQRPGMMVPEPTRAEREQMAAWLRCGAPAATTRLHAGYADVGAFTGDYTAVDPNRAGALSGDRLMGAAVANPYRPDVPDALFAVDRAGPARLRVPVPGAGRYAVSLYFADTVCASTGAACRQAFDVSVAGRPWLTGFDIATAAGGTRRVIARRTAVDLPAGSRLAVEVGARGRLQALEVVRVERCETSSNCPRGFVCTSGACAAGPDDPPGLDASVPDAGVADAGVADAGVADAGVADASVSDAIEVDAGVADASVSDAGVADAIEADASVPGIDATFDATRDVGPVVGSDPPEGASSGCDAARAPRARGASAALAVLALLTLVRGRRRA